MIGTALLAGWLLVGQAAADDANLAAEVHKLIRRLDAPRLAERQAAKEELVKLGPRVLALLPEPGPDTPPGVAEILAGLRRDLQQAAAGTAAEWMPGGSWVAP